jgi:hypothetical protein
LGWGRVYAASSVGLRAEQLLTHLLKLEEVGQLTWLEAEGTVQEGLGKRAAESGDCVPWREVSVKRNLISRLGQVFGDLSRDCEVCILRIYIINIIINPLSVTLK